MDGGERWTMSSIYQGTCAHCERKTDPVEEGHGAVLVDDAQDQSGASGGERLVALGSSTEEEDLARTGHSWTSAFWQGRYVRTTSVVCRSCGRAFPRRRLAAPPRVGGATALGIALVSGVAVGALERDWFVGLCVFLIVVLLAIVLLDALAQAYTRRRFADRARAVSVEGPCPVCGAADSVAVQSARSVPCASCGERSVRFRAVEES